MRMNSQPVEVVCVFDPGMKVVSGKKLELCAHWNMHTLGMVSGDI